jgi:hypothetical protein
VAEGSHGDIGWPTVFERAGRDGWWVRRDGKYSLGFEHFDGEGLFRILVRTHAVSWCLFPTAMSHSAEPEFLIERKDNMRQIGT